MDATTWLDNRIKALRLENSAETEEQVERAIDVYVLGLGMAIGFFLQERRYEVFGDMLTMIIGAYKTPEPTAPAATPPVLATILTPSELEGAELRANRLRRGMTQFQVGDGIGATNSTISLWERAEAKLTDHDRQKLARFFADHPVQLKIKGIQ